MRSALGCIAAGLLLCASGALAAEPPTVNVPADGRPAPRWAVNELQWLDTLQKCYHLFLDRIVEGKGDLPACKQLTVNGGCDDDYAEGVAIWDRYALQRHDPRVQEAYVKFWHTIYQDSRMPAYNGFMCTGGFDPEHTSELFELLWGAMDIQPTDAKLISDNQKLMDFVIGEFYDPKLRLMTNTHAFKGRKAQDRGDTIENCMWTAGAFYAFLAGGDEKYRRFALDYGTSWNELAADNEGMFPYYVPPDTRKLGPTWWTSVPNRGSFGYDVYGIVMPMRYGSSLATMLRLLDKGDPKHVSGLASTVDYLFSHGEGDLPATGFDPKAGKMVREKKGASEVPRLLDRAYVESFDTKWQERMKTYAQAANQLDAEGKPVAPGEAMFMGFQEFTYLGARDTEWLADLFAKQAEQREKNLDDLRKGDGLHSGDDILEKYPINRWGMEFIDGCFWGQYDNGRCGAPLPASVRYFTADGQPGMPLDIAAVVRHVGKDKVTLLLHNRAAGETALMLTAGFYGQHRFTTAKVGEGSAQAVGGRRVKLVLAPGATTELTLGIERYVNPPTLQPQLAPQ